MSKHHRWTPEENALLIEHWSSADIETLRRLFPGRTMNQLTVHVQHLRSHGIELQIRPRMYGHGKEYYVWTDKAVALLIKNWPVASEEELLKLFPGQTMHNLETKAGHLRKSGTDVPHRRISRNAPWSAHDTQTLIEHWTVLPSNQLLAKFENKNLTMNMCYVRVTKLRNAGIHIPQRPMTLDMQTNKADMGVSCCKRNNTWRAEIRFGGGKYSIGTCKNKSDALALRARADAAIEPFRNELQQLAGVRTDPEFQKARSEIITRGHQVLTELKQQIKTEKEKNHD